MESLLMQARELREQGKLQESNQLFMQLVANEPNNPSYNFQCAWSYDAIGEESKAVPFYEKAIKLGLSKSELKGAYLGLGSTYRTLGKYQESKRIFEQAMKEFPTQEQFKVFYAMTLFNLQEHAEAMEVLLKCIIHTTQNEDILAFQKAILFYSDKLDKKWS